MPMFNPRLFVGRDFLAAPDCWWPDAGVAAEVNSREWHLSPRDWENTLARQARMAAAGIIVLHFPPSRIYTERKEVIAEIRSALAAGRTRCLRCGPCRPGDRRLVALGYRVRGPCGAGGCPRCWPPP
jgi:hypothetical protein